MKKHELYQLLEESESDFKNDRTLTFEDSMKKIREQYDNDSYDTSLKAELDWYSVNLSRLVTLREVANRIRL